MCYTFFVVAGSSHKAELDDLAARNELLQTELDSVQKQLTLSHQSQSKAEKELKEMSSKFDLTVTEKDKEIAQCRAATQTVRKELEDRLDEDGYVDRNVLGTDLFSLPLI